MAAVLGLGILAYGWQLLTAKAAAPFLRGAFNEMGHKAIDGMRRWLGARGTAA